MKLLETDRLIGLRTFRAEKEKRGLDDAALARDMGIGARAFKSYLTRGFPSAYLRARAEAVFSYQPFWNPASVVEARRRCKELLGFDPALLTVHELRVRCRERGVPGVSNFTSPQLITAFIAHFAANPPKPTPPV